MSRPARAAWHFHAEHEQLLGRERHAPSSCVCMHAGVHLQCMWQQLRGARAGWPELPGTSTLSTTSSLAVNATSPRGAPLGLARSKVYLKRSSRP